MFRGELSLQNTNPRRAGSRTAEEMLERWSGWLNRCWAVVCCCSSAGSQNGALGLFCSSYLSSPATPRASALHQDRAHLEALCLPRAAPPLWGSFVVGPCYHAVPRQIAALLLLETSPALPALPAAGPLLGLPQNAGFPL